jgi:hypothetical protein
VKTSGRDAISGDEDIDRREPRETPAILAVAAVFLGSVAVMAIFHSQPRLPIEHLQELDSRMQWIAPEAEMHGDDLVVPCWEDLSDRDKSRLIDLAIEIIALQHHATPNSLAGTLHVVSPAGTIFASYEVGEHPSSSGIYVSRRAD